MYNFVASFGSDNVGAATLTQTAVGTFAAGEYVIVPIEWAATTGTITSVVDNLGNTYTQIGAPEQTGYSTTLYYCAGVVGGAATITVTWGVAQLAQRIRAIRYTGLTGAPQTSAVLAQYNPATTADTVTSGALTPIGNPAMLFGWSVNTTNTVISAGTGFTARDAASVGGLVSLSEDKRLTANTATAATFTNAATTAWVKGYALIISEAATPAPFGGGFKKLLLAMGYFAFATMVVVPYLAAADIGGWRTYTPVTTNGTDNATRSNYLTMTGSRIHYVDPSLTVATTQLALDQAATWNATTNPHGGPYLWNGTNIIDMSGNTAPLTGAFTGVPYGTDPMNPSAAVQAFKRVSYTLYNSNGNNRLNGTLSGGAGNTAGHEVYYAGQGRVGMPDWFLIKRGTTLLLRDDLYNNALEGNAAITYATMTDGSLAVPGGNSLSAMSVVGAYGPLTSRRPVVKQQPIPGFVSRWGNQKPIEFFAYTSLYFDGHDRSHYANSNARGGVTFLYSPGTANVKTVWFEDGMFTGTNGFLVEFNTNFCVDLIRCQVFDSFDPAKCQGIFTDNTGLSQVNLIDCMVGRNGSTTDPVIGFTENSLTRNYYQSGEADAINGQITNCLWLPGASGDQFRAGINLRGNYIMNGGVGLSGQNGAAYGTAQANTGSFQNNVMERFYQVVTGGAGGFAAFFGAHDVDSSGNVQTDAGMLPADRITYSAGSSGGMSVGGFATGWYHEQLAPTKSNNFHANVIINRGGATSLNTEEGVNLSSLTNVKTPVSGTYTWNMLGSQALGTLASAAAGGATVLTLTATVALGAPSSVYTVGITQTDSSIFWTELVSKPTTTTLTLTTPLPVGAAAGAAVEVWSRDKYVYRGSTLNAFQNNTVIGQSDANANASTYTLRSTAGAVATDDTSYINNTYMTSAAAIGAGYDLDRCLATYLASINFPGAVTNQTAIRDLLVTYVKANIWKGQYDGNLNAKKIVNHVRAGVLLAALP